MAVAVVDAARLRAQRAADAFTFGNNGGAISAAVSVGDVDGGGGSESAALSTAGTSAVDMDTMRSLLGSLRGKIPPAVDKVLPCGWEVRHSRSHGGRPYYHVCEHAHDRDPSKHAVTRWGPPSALSRFVVSFRDDAAADGGGRFPTALWDDLLAEAVQCIHAIALHGLVGTYGVAAEAFKAVDMCPSGVVDADASARTVRLVDTLVNTGVVRDAADVVFDVDSPEEGRQIQDALTGTLGDTEDARQWRMPEHPIPPVHVVWSPPMLLGATVWRAEADKRHFLERVAFAIHSSVAAGVQAQWAFTELDDNSCAEHLLTVCDGDGDGAGTRALHVPAAVLPWSWWGPPPATTPMHWLARDGKRTSCPLARIPDASLEAALAAVNLRTRPGAQYNLATLATAIVRKRIPLTRGDAQPRVLRCETRLVEIITGEDEAAVERLMAHLRLLRMTVVEARPPSSK